MYFKLYNLLVNIKNYKYFNNYCSKFIYNYIELCILFYLKIYIFYIKNFNFKISKILTPNNLYIKENILKCYKINKNKYFILINIHILNCIGVGKYKHYNLLHCLEKARKKAFLNIKYKYIHEV